MTAERGFSVGTVLKFGWRTSRANLGAFVPLLLLILLIAVISQALDMAARDHFPLGLLVSLLTMAVSLTVSLGTVRVALACLDEGRVSVRDLLPPLALVPPFLVATFLFVLMILGGLLLGIVPGILWGVRCSLYPYLIADSGLGAMDALKGSARLTKGARWDVFLLALTEGIVNLLGLLCLGLGLFLTVPTGWLAKGRAYRTLLAQSEAAQEELPAAASVPSAIPSDEDPPTAS